jgi:hypothetical protein
MNTSKLMLGTAGAVIAISAIGFTGCSMNHTRDTDTSSTAQPSASAQAYNGATETPKASTPPSDNSYQQTANTNNYNANATTMNTDERAPRADRG